MPELEVWTSSLLGKRSTVTTVNRVGINFGAPGDRLSKSGTLWLDYPSVGDHSPDIIIKVTAGEKMNTFRSHALRVQGEMPWVTASGIRNVESIDIELKLVTKQTKMDIQIFGERPATKAPAKKAAPRNFTIRLYFREPDKLKAGERVFSLSMQDKVLLKDFDIAKESAGATVVREFKGISISQNLAIKFTPDAKSKAKPLICGIELIEEK
ncbi:MAG: hypothetical protein HRT89_22195 [Lentisphaeria bacterium]|nr:hypothetical protein [Lentisphaeria bacterium]